MNKKKKSFPLLEYIKDRNEEAEATVLFFKKLEDHVKELRSMREKGVRETLMRCRPGSVLEDIVQLFWDRTDLPLTLAYWYTLGILGGIITQGNRPITFGDQLIDANLWVLLMAESGMGKTWTLNRIKNLAGDVVINEAGYRTKPALIHDLNENPEYRRGVLCIDEMAQTIRLFRRESGADLKEAFLMSYDGKLSSTTKKDGRIEIPDIAFTVLACTVLSTFTRTLTDEDMLDGFVQRFLLIKADEKERNMKNWPYEIHESDTAGIREKMERWREKLEGIRGFYLTRDAHDLWKNWYHKHFAVEYESYYKRYLWATLKMAAVFHTLGTRVDGNITVEDMGYAIRALDNSLESLYEIMDRHMNFSAVERTVQAVRGHIERFPQRTSREVLRALKLSKGELVTALKILRDRDQVAEATYNKLAGEK